eukprot:3222812-Ditylum_brightwellii.AAC.1
MAEGNEVMDSHQEDIQTAWVMDTIRTRSFSICFEINAHATGFLPHHLHQLKFKQQMEWLRGSTLCVG